MQHTILTQQLDMNDFYEVGVTTCKLQRSIYDELDHLMKSLSWVEDPEKTYSSVPDFVADNRKNNLGDAKAETLEWDYDRNGTIECFPESFRILLEKIIKKHLVEWANAYDFQIIFMDMWDGAEDCPWHWDGTDDSDIIMLCYINDYAQWEPSWGGQLLVGKRHLTSKGLFSDFNEINDVQTLLPQRRTLALVNNRNPKLVHKPEPLSGGHERKVFTAGIRLSPRKSLTDSTKVSFGTSDSK